MPELQFVHYSSLINPSFWHKLTQLKLDVDKLDDSERHIWASLNYCDSSVQLYIEVDSTSFNDKYDVPSLCLPFYGVILNKNTIEEFKEGDKNNLMQQQAKGFQEKILELAVESPSKLNYFFVLSFADLKKYHYYYWFAFPAPLELKLPVTHNGSIETKFFNEQLKNILKSILDLPSDQKALFITKSDGTILTLSEFVTNGSICEPGNYFTFIDASNTKNAYSWTLKNILVLLTQNSIFRTLIGQTVSFIALRLSRCEKALSIKDSEVFQVQIPETCGDSGWVGWERNDRGNMGPRMTNMKNTIDPKKLSETSVDLNLKLMKWRLLPDIDLEKIKSLKCLLLGSGTLGCSVARVLLAWGVRHINFVDNSTVSHSNPVRQSLFKFDDAVKSRFKADAAAENLREIFPGVISAGHNINILMPGHPIGDSLLVQARDHFSKLDELIKNADIIFLLMDSRESRWLPTLLSQHHGKIVINAALGFDTYLVMRHGISSIKAPEQKFKHVHEYEMISGDKLGCYFCNDVTAPGNSLKDRTLDKQCTVTRPGVSQIAGALAVELAISLSQHQSGPFAPAYYRKLNQTTSDASLSTVFDTELEDCLLGIIPHSIRGFLSNYTQVLPATQRYVQCIACSEPVLQKYKGNGFDFLMEVFQSSKVLEDLTGLTEIYNTTMSDDWEFSESEDAFEDNN